MSIKRASSAKISHHAYLVLGGEGQRESAHYSFPTLGINEARVLRERESLAGENEEIIIYTEAMTEEGQNALLKTLEEPATGLTFTILAPTSIQLLPTLLSRLEIIEAKKETEDDFDLAKKFVAFRPSERLKWVADFVKKNGKPEALKFLTDLEKFVAENKKAENMSSELIFAFAQIRQGREYLGDKSGTPKLILEHIAVILP